MLKPPQLAPFDTKEQWLYFELSPDVRAPHQISKAEPYHPSKEVYFGLLYPRSHSFGYYPELMTIGEILT